MNLELAISNAKDAMTKTVIPTVNRKGLCKATSDTYATEAELSAALNYTISFLSAYDIKSNNFEIEYKEGGKCRFSLVAFNEDKMARYLKVKRALLAITGLCVAMAFGGLVIGVAP